MSDNQNRKLPKGMRLPTEAEIQSDPIARVKLPSDPETIRQMEAWLRAWFMATPQSQWSIRSARLAMARQYCNEAIGTRRVLEIIKEMRQA
jgi:hypothetical protein